MIRATPDFSDYDSGDGYVGTPHRPPARLLRREDHMASSGDENDDDAVVSCREATRATCRPKSGTIDREILPKAPPPVLRDLVFNVERPSKDRLDGMFVRSDRVVATIDKLAAALGTSVDANVLSELLRAREEVLSLARLAAMHCEEYAAEVTCMRQTLAEELVDLDVYATRVLERQRVLENTGFSADSNTLKKSLASVDRIEIALSALHPHESYTNPASSNANATMLARASSSIA